MDGMGWDAYAMQTDEVGGSVKLYIDISWQDMG